MPQGNLTFGFQVGAVGQAGMSDLALYRDMKDDARLGQSLGYRVAWVIEHHFTNYFPTPNPLMLLSYLAGICPGLGLGTSVMVLPWYHPVRFAEDVAMLQMTSDAELHIGLGRGVAKMEYDALGVPMHEARERFRDAYQIIEKALRGEPITNASEFWDIGREVSLRPRLGEKRPNFYGAIGSPASAPLMADLGLPPIAIAQFPNHVLKAILDNWTAAAIEKGIETDVMKPVMVQCYIADSEEQARVEASSYLTRYFQEQVNHYEADANPWQDIAGYEQFSRTFVNLKKMATPEGMGGFMDMNFIGTPDTVAGRLEALRDVGFNHIIVTNSTPGVPAEARHRMLRRFAGDVAPRFGVKMLAA